jgi:hypothetical protein
LSSHVENPLAEDLQQAYSTAEDPEAFTRATTDSFQELVRALPVMLAWGGVTKEEPFKRVVIFGHGGPGVVCSLQELEQLISATEGSKELTQVELDRLATVQWCDPAPEVRQ